MKAKEILKNASGIIVTVILSPIIIPTAIIAIVVETVKRLMK